MRISKVYTKTGDKGTTGLVGGERVKKNHVRIESYGDVDELNSSLGLVRCFNRESTDSERDRIESMLHRIQQDLFNMGADLATPPDKRWPNMTRTQDSDVERLEQWIDELNADLPPLKEFILPGGRRVSAFLHQARTQCRRSERRVLSLMEAEPEVEVDAMKYLNRLSDFLFVLGRFTERDQGNEELWDRTTDKDSKGDKQ
jgi:cob(I)alamin adenosyltransferase